MKRKMPLFRIFTYSLIPFLGITVTPVHGWFTLDIIESVDKIQTGQASLVKFQCLRQIATTSLVLGATAWLCYTAYKNYQTVKNEREFRNNEERSKNEEYEKGIAGITNYRKTNRLAPAQTTPPTAPTITDAYVPQQTIKTTSNKTILVGRFSHYM